MSNSQQSTDSLPPAVPLPATSSSSSTSAPTPDQQPDSNNSSESEGGNVSEGGTREAFSKLSTDERHFEDSKKRLERSSAQAGEERKAQLVMGPPLGGPKEDEVIEGQTIEANEDILADLDDEATDLELTHLRLRTLRGLGIERFRDVEVRHNLSLPPRLTRI